MNDSMVALLQRRFSERWNETLLVDLDGRRFTYGEVWSNARRIAKDWRSSGVSDGNAVCLMLANGPESLCCYLACFIGGFIAAPVNPELSEIEVAQIHSILKPRAIVREIPALQAGGSLDDAKDLATVDDSVCAIFFTSGTTGLPKGVRHTFRSLAGNVVAFNRLSGIESDACMYHVLPMAYMAGFLNTFLSPLMAGGRIVIGPRFTPQSALSFWERPGRENANVMWLSPSIAASLCRTVRDASAARRVAQHIRIFCGTAPLHDAVREKFSSTFGVPLQESYGTSELLLISAQSRTDAAQRRDVGQLLSGVTISSQPHVSGQDELVVRSPFAFRGYLTEKGEVEPEIHDGFHVTGDVGEICEGRLKITGRIKDLIIRGGVNVAPVAIENALSDLATVRDVAVIGLPHEFWGEAIAVCVEATGDHERAITDVRQRCRERMGRAQQPDRIEVIERFPRSTTGKVQKNKLRAMLVK